MKKRIFALFMSFALAFTLCACGGGDSGSNSSGNSGSGNSSSSSAANDDNSSNPSSEDGESSSSSSQTSTGDPLTGWILEDNPESISGTVRFWIPFKGNQGMDAMIADFNTIYPNITVELSTYNNNSDGNLAVNTAIMAEEIDVLSSFGIGNAYRRWENGMYMDLTDKIADEGIDLIANWGTDAYNYNGRIYTLPNGGLSDYIAINMDKWNAAGLGELPTEWTWDEYLEACRKMTELNPDGSVAVYGGSLNHTISDYMLAKYQVTGKDMWYNDEGMSSFNDPIIVNALQREYNAEMVEHIWFPLLDYRADNVNVSETYHSQQVASAMTDNLSRYLNNTEEYSVTWKTGFAPFPVEEKGQTNYMSGIRFYSHTGVISTAQDPEAAWAFCKWFSTYGSNYLIAAGHVPTWKGTKEGSQIEMAFGSREKAETLIDVDSFVRCFAVTSNPSSIDTSAVASDELSNIVTEYALAIMRGEYSVEEGSELMQQLGDEAIANAS